MKAEHRMGKGEFSYLRDWDAEEEGDSKKPPYKDIIRQLIAEEVQTQVAAKVDAAVSKAMSEMHAKMDTSRADRQQAETAAAASATLRAKVEGLEATVRALQAKTQVVQTPQGKIVMQQPMAAKPAAYSIDVQRGSDGLVKSLSMTPKG